MQEPWFLLCFCCALTGLMTSVPSEGELNSCALSVGDRSGLIMKDLSSLFLLEKTLETSAALLNFTRSGRGHSASSWYLPSRRESLIEYSLKELSSLEMMEVTLLRSTTALLNLEVPFGHSFTPYNLLQC